MTDSMKNLYKRARELKDRAEYGLNEQERENGKRKYTAVMREINETMDALEGIF